MGRDHWFDTLNTSLVRAAHRRGFLHAAGMLGAALVFGNGDITQAAENRNNKRRKQKQKRNRPKPPPPPPPLCSGGACAAEPEWAGKPGQIGHCEFICRQCDGDDPREFCIVEGNLQDPAKIAVCCEEGETCCGEECCAADRHCCGGKACCAATQTCCGDNCGPSPNNPVVKCCNGRIFDTSVNPEHCGDRGNRCEPGQVCRDGECVCPDPHQEYCGPERGCRFTNGGNALDCGGCGVQCPATQACLPGGICGCIPPEEESCGPWCMPRGQNCCEGGPAGHYWCPPSRPCCGYHIPPHISYCDEPHVCSS